MATKRTQSQRPPGHQSTSQIFDPIYTSEPDSDESGVSTEEEQDPTYDYSSEEMDYLGVQDDDGENDAATMEDLEEEVVDIVADEDDSGPPENEDMNGAESSEFEWDVSRSRNRTSRESKSKVNQPIQQKNRQRVDRAELNRRSIYNDDEYSPGDSSSSTPIAGSRIMTKRQRAKLNENYQPDLLQLPMAESTRKKHLTEEEIALRKSEIARRRKHQSIQRAEQDKMDTINRLLKKQNTKRRSKDQDDIDNQEGQSNTARKLPPPPPLPTSYRYINSKEGSLLSIPIGYECPIPFIKEIRYPPPIPPCSVPGCSNPKKYRSAKTHENACSMEHLKLIDGRT
ncbi:5851_t:CDS:2 [Paraglomus occultum]|uniref:5851_t:CDS:1 n=1 Tax=Paraglomus occultum TaxID=144539 RepID=A0A9N8VLQ9_9GLOM|nr:5851_t:CDS:2 [Paraglomus occultum]